MAEVIVIRRPLVKSEIDRNQYTLSLLRQAFKKGLINERELNGIRSRIMLLLKDLILKFTGYNSTSVRTEAAERLLNSLYYALDAYTYGIGDAMEALVILKKSRLEDIYKNGIEVIKACVAESKIMVERLSDERLEFGTEAYECLFDDLRGFFGSYDILFAAHDTNASFDYPVLFDDALVKGVFYVRQYMEKFDLETRFIKYFRAEEVLKLLKNHGRQNRIDYGKLMINIFELVLSHALYSILGGGEAGSLTLSDIQCGLIEKRLAGLSDEEIGENIKKAFRDILGMVGPECPEIASYVLKYEPAFIRNTMTALNNNTLCRIITTGNKGYSLGGSIILNEGKRLSSTEFYLLVSAIMWCDNIIDKKNIIRQSIKTRRDFIDILEADCLFEDDFDFLYRSMEDVELAWLGNALFLEELRESPFESVISDKEPLYDEEWQNRFVLFLKNLDRVRLESISRAAALLEGSGTA